MARGSQPWPVELGQDLGLPVIHLDRLHWLPGWVEPDKERWRNKVADLVTGHEWVMDGNYGGSLDIRIPAADTIVFMDYSPLVCLWRVIMRRVRYRDGGRPDMAEGCPEKLDPEFLKWVWNFRRDRRPGILKKIADRGPGTELVVLRSPREATAFLSQVRVGRQSAASGLDQGHLQ